MRKKITVLIVIFFLCFIGFTMFYNGFLGIESITIQKEDEPFQEGKVITDKDKIAIITGILNRANHITHTAYKLAIKPTYKIQLTYKDKSTEVLYVIENFDKDITLLDSDQGDYYKISEKQMKKILELLLK
ncbi:hypothetical protein [Peribacillus acanthi]|uniref:hypothetical protein n=1 Tax=Peribacillus acanthi TaxID=2171554 RepID=UPI000D3E193E|nr:hypothetical protein [Peribacillus acanthi]